MKFVAVQSVGSLDSWAEAAKSQGVEATTCYLGTQALNKARHAAGREWAEGAIVLIDDGVKVTHEWLTELRSVARAVILRVCGPRPTQAILRAVSGVVTPHPWLGRKLAAEGLTVLPLQVGFDPRLAGVSITHLSPPDDVLTPWQDRPWIVSAFTPWRKDDAHALVTCAQEISHFQYCCPANKDTPEILQKRNGLTPLTPEGYSEALARSRFVVDYHAPPSVVPKDDGNGVKRYTTNQLTVDAVGCGAVLVTEQSVNLARYFKPWVECVPYDNPREAAIYTHRELHNPEHAAKIAKAGQARVWQEHLITHRVPRLLDFAERVSR